MAAYYNEFKPEAAHMLLQLIANGLIAPGDVDERPIQEVKPDDIRGYKQCHFFAGIGGWSVSLRLAGWPDDRPVWTGSCPCQPFSTAGKQKGKADERHLWPAWFRLIRECRPAIVFGEQVASAVAHGWWDDVASDMEAEGYACAAAVLPACSVGKPHKRDRLWFVADAELRGCERQPVERCGGVFGSLDEAREAQQPAGAYSAVHAQPCDVADTQRGGRQGQGAVGEPINPTQNSIGQANQPFDDSAGIEWLLCPDGKQRPVKRGICLLAHGVQHRAPILHAFGNAIVPQVAAHFIQASEGWLT